MNQPRLKRLGGVILSHTYKRLNPTLTRFFFICKSTQGDPKKFKTVYEWLEKFYNKTITIEYSLFYFFKLTPIWSYLSHMVDC